MNVYDYIDSFAAAVVGDAAVLAYCTTNFDQGLQVQIDDDSEDPLGSEAAPYCLFMAVFGSDDSPVSEESVINIRIEVGTKPTDDEEPPYKTETTERTASANGLRKYGQGEKATDLLSLILEACKGTVLADDTLLKQSSIDANGSLFFPLAMAVSTLSVSETKCLASFG